MKLTTLFERLYSKIYIAIVEDGERIEVATEIFAKKQNSEESVESFSSFDEAKDYILDTISDSPYYYISLLNSSKDQGALPTCDKLKMRDFADVSLSTNVCIDEKWVLYSSTASLKVIEKKHMAYGLDYIFSPFTILHDFFKDKIKEVLGLYVLVQNESLSIAVFSSSKLEFALHVATDSDSIALMDSSSDIESDFEISEDIDDSLDEEEFGILDDIEALDEMDSLDDIETLDDIDNIESFEDFTEDSDEVSVQEPKEQEQSIEGFNLDFHRFSIIQDALKTFYKDEIYENSFIEAVFIADSVGVSKDLKNYLEEELFVTPIVRGIDLAKELLKLSKEEVLNAS